MNTKTIAIVTVIAVAVICIAAFVAFGQGEKKDPEPVNPPVTGDKILVVYFSATGVTADVANEIADYLDAETYRIVPVQPYTNEDLDRDNPDCRAFKEDQDASCRPAIEGGKIDISEYSTILLGFPIWYKIEPKIILTFLDTYDLTGRTVIPFCTSWNTGIVNAEYYLKTEEPGANWIRGTDFQSNSTIEEIHQWVDSLNLKK